ncbi:MAG: hypothetical protein RQ751_11790, partial [Longimicrobiales bacterium]|nr:hypothetical protein [Longimicrobiales bacterium]
SLMPVCLPAVHRSPWFLHLSMAIRSAASGLVLVAAGLPLAVTSTPLQAQDYYADVRPILVENCVGCHSEDGIAWSMEDPEEAYRRRARIARAVTRRIMPPWLAEPGHQAYVGDLSLDDASVRVLERWAEAGYPRGTPRPDPTPRARHAADGGAGGAAAHARFVPDLSLDVLPAAGYLPDQDASDDYRCFLVEWEEAGSTFVTGFRADPGNRNVAHHVVVYAVEPAMAARFRELEAEEEGDGYQCFGGALPDRLGQPEVRTAYEARYPDGIRELALGNFWLAHWAPGMDGHVFPAGTGIRVGPGSLLVVQMHYYSSNAPGERDRDTRVDFMTAEAVERPAFHLAQTRNDWLAAARNGTMVIPAGERRTFEVRDNLGGLLGYFARLTGVERERIRGLEIHSANLHMHSFGHSGRVTLRHDTGRMETLLSVPRWDLAWQRDFTFTEPKVFPAEALERVLLGVECTFENPTDEPVYGGYGSLEEMCFNFSYIAVVEGEPPAKAGSGAGFSSGAGPGSGTGPGAGAGPGPGPRPVGNTSPDLRR